MVHKQGYSSKKPSPDASDSPAFRLELRNNPAHFRNAVILILLLAAFVRLEFLQGDAARRLWNDELLSAQWSTGRSMMHWTLPVGVVIDNPVSYTRLENAEPLGKIWTCLENDVQGPVYYLLLRVWRETVGFGDRGMQMLSVTASVAAVLFLILGTKLLSGQITALWAGVLLAVSPTQILFSREVRPYALAVLLVTLAFWAVMRIYRQGANWKNCLLFGTALLLTMLTHYYTFGVLAALVLWGIWVLKKSDRWRFIATIVLAAAVFAALWGPMLFRQYENTRKLGNVDWVKDPPGEGTLLALGRFTSVPTRVFADVFTGATDGNYNAYFLIGLLAFSACTLRVVWRRDLLLPWLMLTGGILFVAFMDIATSTKQLTLTRFVVALTPAYCILLAGLASNDLRRRWTQLMPVAVLLLSLGLIVFGVLHARARSHWLMPFEEVCTLFESRSSSEELVVLFTPRKAELTQNTYLGLLHYFHGKPPRILLLDRQPTPADMQILRQYKSFWCVWMFYRRTKSQFEDFVPTERYLIPEMAMITRFQRRDTLTRESYRKPELQLLPFAP